MSTGQVRHPARPVTLCLLAVIVVAVIAVSIEDRRDPSGIGAECDE